MRGQQVARAIGAEEKKKPRPQTTNCRTCFLYYWLELFN